MMNNAELSLQIFSFLKKIGVENIVICAGARNAPLVLALEEHDFKVYNFFEERSAAFFSMGLIKATGKPAAVLTTSGTAAAELLPAIIEAHYQNLPLIAVTADRPKKYRGTGSPQTIEQLNIYGSHVEKSYDLDVNTNSFTFELSLKKPIHINVCFDEPLVDKANSNESKVLIQHIPKKKSDDQFSTKQFLYPLVILGSINENQKEEVLSFLKKIKSPIYAETISLLSKNDSLDDFLISSSEQICKKIFNSGLCDSVIRIGGVPTLRFWRDLEKEFSQIPVANFSETGFSGLARDSFNLSIEDLAYFDEYPKKNLVMIREIDASLEKIKIHLLKKYPRSEQSLTHALSQLIAVDPIYLGNSMPIRYWDEFSGPNQNKSAYANRGVNGIDGQISTYLGWSVGLQKSYCYIGDLTALYDLSALGLVDQLPKASRNIVIMNNFGGQIFNRVFKNKNFINPHKTKFEHWAKMWGWNYTNLSDESSILAHKTTADNNVIEIFPDNTQTELFWNEWDNQCRQIKL